MVHILEHFGGSLSIFDLVHDLVVLAIEGNLLTGCQTGHNGCDVSKQERVNECASQYQECIEDSLICSDRCDVTNGHVGDSVDYEVHSMHIDASVGSVFPDGGIVSDP